MSNDQKFLHTVKVLFLLSFPRSNIGSRNWKGRWEDKQECHYDNSRKGKPDIAKLFRQRQSLELLVRVDGGRSASSWLAVCVVEQTFPERPVLGIWSKEVTVERAKGRRTRRSKDPPNHPLTSDIFPEESASDSSAVCMPHAATARGPRPGPAQLDVPS